MRLVDHRRSPRIRPAIALSGEVRRQRHDWRRPASSRRSSAVSCLSRSSSSRSATRGRARATPGARSARFPARAKERSERPVPDRSGSRPSVRTDRQMSPEGLTPAPPNHGCNRARRGIAMNRDSEWTAKAAGGIGQYMNPLVPDDGTDVSDSEESGAITRCRLDLRAAAVLRNGHAFGGNAESDVFAGQRRPKGRRRDRSCRRHVARGPVVDGHQPARLTRATPDSRPRSRARAGGASRRQRLSTSGCHWSSRQSDPPLNWGPNGDSAKQRAQRSASIVAQTCCSARWSRCPPEMQTIV
jgi:hypothetical protein